MKLVGCYRLSARQPRGILSPEFGHRGCVDPRPQFLGDGPPLGAGPEPSEHRVQAQVDALEDDVCGWHVARPLDAGAARSLQLEQLARRLRRVRLVQYARMVIEHE